ncbi:MAG: hypothetical protein ACJAVM_000021 [Sulfitobacter sp.]|jgi:hypothetical protein
MPHRRIFLERRSYRMRRMMDAVRLLPLLGLCLWMVPLLWPVPMPDPVLAEGAISATMSPAMPPTMPMSAALRYIFGIWFALVIAAWALWRHTRDHVVSDPSASPEGPL